MNKTIYFASDMCPVGCGEVMFVQGATNKNVFCYCTGCGVAFLEPKQAQCESDNFDISKRLEHFSADSVILPSKVSIDEAGFSKWICGTSNENEWYSEQELNNEHYKNT